jgi:hypothetical protein
MTHRFMYPTVTEIRTAESTTDAPPDRLASQRELVQASLLLCSKAEPRDPASDKRWTRKS